MGEVFPNERWVDVIGFEGAYRISDHGRVLSLRRTLRSGRTSPERILKPALTNKGYLRVELQLDRIRQPALVHRLVAMHFLEMDPAKPQVNHIDGVRTNNVLPNLEWVDNGGNKRHSLEVLGHGMKPVIATRLSDGQVTRFPSLISAIQIGHNAGCLWKCLNGKRAHHKGHAWNYAEKSNA